MHHNRPAENSLNTINIKMKEVEARKMAQWVKVLSCKPKELSSVPETHVKVDGENSFLKVV